MHNNDAIFYVHFALWMLVLVATFTLPRLPSIGTLFSIGSLYYTSAPLISRSYYWNGVVYNASYDLIYIYISTLLAALMMIITEWFFTRFNHSKVRLIEASSDISDIKVLYYFSSFLSLALMFLTVKNIGFESFLYANTQYIRNNTGFERQVLQYTAILSFVSALILKKNRYLLLPVIAILFLLLLRLRMPLLTCLLVSFVFYTARYNLRVNVKFIFLIPLFVIFIPLVTSLNALVRMLVAGSLSSLKENIFSIDFWISRGLQGEMFAPYVNLLVAQDLDSRRSIVDAFIYSPIPLTESLFGVDVVRFSHIIQNKIGSDLSYTLASSLYGQLYGSGGAGVVFLYILIVIFLYFLIIFYFSRRHSYLFYILFLPGIVVYSAFFWRMEFYTLFRFFFTYVYVFTIIWVFSLIIRSFFLSFRENRNCPSRL